MMLDITKRMNLSGLTVKEAIHVLSQLPSNALFCCCGDNCAYIHVEKDGSAVTIDWSDLEEYYREIE